VTVELTSQGRGDHPTSERWQQYYREARRRRRARGPQARTRVQLRRYRNRQLAGLMGGFLTVGVLVAIFYFVLEH
jgi:hypothetical protein